MCCADIRAAGLFDEEDVCIEQEREAASGCGDLELLTSMMEERRGGGERTGRRREKDDGGRESEEF